jgi:p25-alpha
VRLGFLFGLAQCSADLDEKEGVEASSFLRFPASGGRQLLPRRVCRTAGMEDIFLRYCAFGAGQRGENLMDNARFGKFCRESRILGPNCNKRDADIIFVRVASAAKRRKITYPEFIHVLERIALRKRMPFTLLEATLQQSGGRGLQRLHAAACMQHAASTVCNCPVTPVASW